MKKFGLLAMTVALVLAFGFSAGIRAEVNAGVAVNQAGQSSFYLSIGDYNKLPEQEVIAVKQRGIPDEEIPTVFFVASMAKVTPQEIVRLRLKRYSWMSIISKYRIHPSVFYVPVKTQVFGTVYKKPYSYYTTRPEAKWGGIKLSDADVNNFVNLRFVSEHYGYEPDEVIKMREGGRNFIAINDEIKALKAKKKFIKARKMERAINRFYTAIAEYNGVEENEVAAIKALGIDDDELPVVFFIAMNAGTRNDEIAKLRLNGWTWMRIVKKYRLNPEIFYVPVNEKVTTGVYGKAYGYYNRPQNSWKNIFLKNDDIVNFVNLQFISEYHGLDPVNVIKMRETGKYFNEIDDDIRMADKKNKRQFKFRKAHDGEEQGDDHHGHGGYGNDDEGDNYGHGHNYNDDDEDEGHNDNGNHKGWDKNKDDNKGYKYYDE